MKKYPVYSIQRFNCNSVNSDFYINTFKNHLITHRFVEQPHRHDFYVLVFFTAGSGTHNVDFNTYNIQPHRVFVLQPGQMHHWSLSEDIEGYVVFYSPEMYNLYFGQKDLDGFAFYYSAHTKSEIVLSATESEALEPLFKMMLLESQAPKNFAQDKILNLLDIIHIELARKYQDSGGVHAPAYMGKIKQLGQLLEAKFAQEKTASFYANALNISLKHLNRICNEMLQKTTTEVIAQRVVLEAKRMLMDKNLTVNEIANHLGYEDYSYFVRLFKKHTGKTPKVFRTQRE
ncbi:helix-turn-helix domain-containing protein [Flavobacterium crassostreae]|uniref:AraC family transcriptional regulator n=1 Tax=Flavobacterium crassostreae TaxID=1763534 RepID=A0A1B9DXM2_9FLAO|nr:helix-turn-helix domain-containing protein [Flavobacterium crassostreae]OCB74441.1 AraC family transcriptional regulator [Flavobacterium crassostreae]